MREDKRKRLTSKGWKVGGTAEFLGLSAKEDAQIEVTIALTQSRTARQATTSRPIRTIQGRHPVPVRGSSKTNRR